MKILKIRSLGQYAMGYGRFSVKKKVSFQARFESKLRTKDTIYTVQYTVHL